MPRMPSGCQLGNLKDFLDCEQLIRSGRITVAEQIDLPEYWRDLALVLLRLADSRFRRGSKKLETNFANISDRFYMNFFVKKPKKLLNAQAPAMVQDELNLGDDHASKK